MNFRHNNRCVVVFHCCLICSFPKTGGGLHHWLSDKESTYQARRCVFNPQSGKIPWRRKWQPIPVFLPGKFHGQNGQRSLAGYSPWGLKRAGYDLSDETTTVKTCVPSQGREDPLEEEVATHSNSLAWKIPWTEEPGGLQSTGSRKVGHS